MQSRIPQGRPRRALVVDDREENTLYLRTLLEAADWEVTCARHGAEALVLARQSRPQVVVSDLLMPVMDGYTLLRQWKADPVLRDAPFIVYTATYTEVEDERLALDLGADAFILKPAEPDEFMARIEAVMTGSACGPAPPRAPATDEAALLKVYSETLIRKLEEKTLQLERANERLQRDIEKLESAEAHTRESELRFRQLAENISEVFWITDPGKQQMLYVSPGYERVWGRSVESLYAAPGTWLDAIHPEDRAAVRVAASRQLEGAYDVSYRILRPDGSIRWIRDRAFPVADAHGNWYRIVGTAQDITAQRAAQEALERTEREQRALATELSRERARLEAAQAVAKLGSWETRLDTLAVSWSPETYRIFGKARESFEPSHEAFLELVHPEDRARIDQAFRSIDDQPHSIEHRILVDGRVKHVEERWQVSFDEHGRPTHATGTCQDITERVLLEEQLRQSQRLEAVGRLTGGVAHDFNNLLTVIIGNAELLAERLAGDPVAPAAQAVVDAAGRGSELVRGLLAFSRKQALSPRSVDVASLLEGLQPLLRPALGGRIELRTIAGKATWPAMVDPTQLESALLNLAINARDAMPGGGRLVIETANVDLDDAYLQQRPFARPGPHVAISVTDTGTGISPEHLSRVFEPFFTTKEAGKGTGLGLAMVYGFVKQSGGHITLYSESGQGTTVRLYLPRAREATGAPARPAPAPRPGSQSVLLVEDDEAVRRQAESHLAALGYRILSAASGERALDILRGAEHVDLLLTDITMPGMSGPVLAERARALRPGLRVLFSSGFAQGALAADGRLAPGEMLLAKPYGRAELASKVCDALG